jgi:enolase-phosphatase E1
MQPYAIVLDIEGTTTPITFVRDVLFPYARERIPEVLRARHSEPLIATLIAEAAELSGAVAVDVQEAIRLFLTWSDADRKLSPLKALQGIVWKQGYVDGTLCSPMYPDVASALRAWRARDIALYVYSSGSVDAQRLLFRYSNEGDLTAHFHGYFDATVGSKIDVNSYRLIQQIIGNAADELLFLSDSVAEIAAARGAGWRAVLVERDGPVPGRQPPAITSFPELVL